LNFAVRGASGYNVEVKGTLEVSINKLNLDVKWYITNLPFASANYISPLTEVITTEGKNLVFTKNHVIQGSQAASGFWIKGEIVKMWAEPGAPAGTRYFDFTMKCDYVELTTP
jgi:hypothetical protein